MPFFFYSGKVEVERIREVWVQRRENKWVEKYISFCVFLMFHRPETWKPHVSFSLARNVLLAFKIPSVS